MKDKQQLEYSIRESILRRKARLLQVPHDAIFINCFNTARILFWNRRASELYGWSPQEAKGKVSDDILQTQFSEPVHKIKTKLVRKGHWEGELIHKKKDGSPIVVQSRWVLQRSFAGEPTDVLQLNQDISAIRKEEERVRQTERLALLGTMAGTLAHEVANPLSGISFALEYVERELEMRPFDGHLRAAVQGALREVGRLDSLLSEFRGIARPQTLDLKKTDLVKIIEEVLACQFETYRALGITVKLEFNDFVPPVMADAGKIKQVILNLCKNGVEAMPTGGYLGLKVYPAGPAVVLEISDTGIGLPGGLDIFELFTTTKPDGSGLGLPLVREIVSAHKGTINYTTEPGHGTTFKIYLPAVNADKALAAREAIEETARKKSE